MSIIEILWPALVLALALVYIHTIFGVEIIKRGVIFTDLAIGQAAATGMAISIAFMDGAYQTLLSLSFAITLAIVISWATKKVHNIEAFIGLLYALGISSIMLILVQSRMEPFTFATLFGSLAILLAIYLSYNLDLPTGYTIIFCIVSSSLVFVSYKSIKGNS